MLALETIQKDYLCFEAKTWPMAEFFYGWQGSQLGLVCEEQCVSFWCSGLNLNHSLFFVCGSIGAGARNQTFRLQQFCV